MLWEFLVCLTLLTAVVTCGAQTPASDFTVILLPDTQYYSKTYPQIFTSQTQWIAAQRSARNIQLVIGEGDIVEDGSSDVEWQNADTSVKVLDQAGIPYVMAIGNHDYDNAQPKNRSAVKFNHYFGPQRYAAYPWFGSGQYPTGSNENCYAKVTMGGSTYLILVLEYIPRDAALDWARQVMANNADKEVILVTHSNMYIDNTRVDQCDTQDLNRDNDGEETWAKFTSQYPNISLVVSGHITGAFTGQRTDYGVNGNLVHQLLTNFQTSSNGGNGWLRILTFHPATNTVDVQTYSPYLNSYRTTSPYQFTWKWHADGSTSSNPLKVVGRIRAARLGYAFDCTALSDASISASAGAVMAPDSDGNYSDTMDPSTSQPNTITVSRPGYPDGTQTVTAYSDYPPEVDFFMQPIVGTIYGRVKNAGTGSGIAGASVTFTGGNIPAAKTFTASSTGDYSSGSIPEGNYQITVSANGYNSATLSDTVTANTRTQLDAMLQSSTPPPPPSCTASTNGVTICSPANGATPASPVTITAAAKSTTTIKLMQIYLDGVLQQTINAAIISVQMALTSGVHRVTVQAQDTGGVVLKSTVNITVQ